MRFDLDMPAWKWPFYVARHPFEGFEDLRWKKAYNTFRENLVTAYMKKLKRAYQAQNTWRTKK